MYIYTWHVIRFSDAYELCKYSIKTYDVDYWDMWDKLISQCELHTEDLVRIDLWKMVSSLWMRIWIRKISIITVCSI